MGGKGKWFRGEKQLGCKSLLYIKHEANINAGETNKDTDFVGRVSQVEGPRERSYTRQARSICMCMYNIISFGVNIK